MSLQIIRMEIRKSGSCPERGGLFSAVLVKSGVTIEGTPDGGRVPKILLPDIENCQLIKDRILP